MGSDLCQKQFLNTHFLGHFLTPPSSTTFELVHIQPLGHVENSPVRSGGHYRWRRELAGWQPQPPQYRAPRRFQSRSQTQSLVIFTITLQRQRGWLSPGTNEWTEGQFTAHQRMAEGVNSGTKTLRGSLSADIFLYYFRMSFVVN